MCKKKGGGRVAALEILIGTPAIANLIREKKTHQIGSMMQTSKKVGMRTMNDSLCELVQCGVITVEEATARSMDRASLLQQLAAAQAAA